MEADRGIKGILGEAVACRAWGRLHAAECALEGLGLKIVRAKGGSEWLSIDTFSRGFREIFRDCDISAKSVRSALKNDPDGIAAIRKVKFSGKTPRDSPCVPLSFILGQNCDV